MFHQRMLMLPSITIGAVFTSWSTPAPLHIHTQHGLNWVAVLPHNLLSLAFPSYHISIALPKFFTRFLNNEHGSYSGLCHWYQYRYEYLSSICIGISMNQHPGIGMGLNFSLVLVLVWWYWWNTTSLSALYYGTCVIPSIGAVPWYKKFPFTVCYTTRYLNRFHMV